MRRKKILIVSYYMYPCHEPVLENVFAKELAKDLDIVWLFCGGKSDSSQVKWHNSHVVIAHRVKKIEGISPSTKILMIIGKYLKLIKLIQQGRFNFVIIRDQPALAVFVAILKRLFRFQLCFQYTAPLGDIDIAYFKNNKKISSFSNYIKGCIHNFFLPFAVNFSNLTFPISKYHGQSLKKMGERNLFIPLTMGVDEDWIFSERRSVPFLESFTKKFSLITYFGTLSFSRNPFFLLEILLEVKKQNAVCKLLLIGKTAYPWEEVELKNKCHEMGLTDDVIIVGQLNKPELADYLSYSSLSISAIPPEPHYIISSPTKLYESMGHGIPVVGNLEIIEQKKVLEDSGGGVAVKYDARDFAKAIVMLLKNDQLRHLMGDRCRKYTLENYTYRVLANRIKCYF